MKIDKDRVEVTFRLRHKNGRFGKTKTISFKELMEEVAFMYDVDVKPSWFDRLLYKAGVHRFFKTRYWKALTNVALLERGAFDVRFRLVNVPQILLGGKNGKKKK